MARYQKIDTVFKRDINNIIMPYNPLVNPTLEWLRQFNVKFDGEEKIDGTNIRLEITHEIGFQSVKPGNLISGVIFTVNYKGKTDNKSFSNINGNIYMSSLIKPEYTCSLTDERYNELYEDKSL